jgi:CheY-like chemotaxis protein
VLVVDDCRDTAGLMRMSLSLLGHETRAAFDGPSALEIAAEFQPEVILLDLTLPGKGGRQVALELRESPATANALIVGISGYSDVGLPPGFDHMLVKPVDHDRLQAVIAAGRGQSG